MLTYFVCMLGYCTFVAVRAYGMLAYCACMLACCTCMLHVGILCLHVGILCMHVGILCLHVGILCMDVGTVCLMNAIDMLEMLCMLNLTQITPHRLRDWDNR